jgi:CubicO group peptidase (beta-lactamase class C family)
MKHPGQLSHRVVDAAFDERSVAEHGLVVGVVSTEGLLASAAHGVPERSAFYLASVSKVFTAMCLMIAADHGALSVDDDIRGIVPELPAWAAGATIGHLLWHTAPLPDYSQLVEASGVDAHGVLTDELILDVLAAHDRPASAPGENFAYSNTGYWLLGVALGRATGGTLRDFADQHLFGPLGMSATWFRDDYREQVPNLAVGHIAPGIPHPASCFDRVGDGGVVSTLHDLTKWECAVLRHHEPWHGLVERISAPVPLTDGSVPNWRAGVVIENVHGHHAVLVGGTALGYRAFGARLPNERLTVFVLADLETANVRGAAFRVIDALLVDT